MTETVTLGRTPSQGLFTQVLRRVTFWHARARSRAALAAMDDRLLEDIGLTRELALRECERAFWE